jgi:hypothetical protein
MITTTINAPPISMIFDRNLLMNTLQRIYYKVETKIKPLSQKKLKDDHIGRRRHFVILLMKFNEAYERKTIEEADYQAEIKEKIKKRPCISTTGVTTRFRRVQS